MKNGKLLLWLHPFGRDLIANMSRKSFTWWLCAILKFEQRNLNPSKPSKRTTYFDLDHYNQSIPKKISEVTLNFLCEVISFDQFEKKPLVTRLFCCTYTNLKLNTHILNQTKLLKESGVTPVINSNDLS